MNDVKKKPYLLMLAVLLLTILTAGCQMLGMANPFSSGKDDFDRAKRELSAGNHAVALKYAASAINRDEKQWPAYKFIVENYDKAISKVDAKLAELESREQNIETLVEKVNTLREMSYFVYYVSGFPGEKSDPKIVEHKKASVAIPLTDYDTLLAEAQAQGYEIAFKEASALINKGEYEEAVESLQVITSRFVSGASERKAAETEIADFLADATAPMVARLGIANLDGATVLLAAARKFEATEKVAAMTEELNSKAPGIVFAEADRIARAGTAAALEEALSVGVKARTYVEDNAEVEPKITGYAQRLADLYKRDIEAQKRSDDGTRNTKWEIENKYSDYLELLTSWSKVSGHEGALEEFAAYIESSRTVVHVVVPSQFANSREQVSKSLEAALADQRGKIFWMFTEANREIADQRARHFRGGSRRWWSANREKADSLIYPDNSSSFMSEVGKLTAESSLDEARAFNIDYLVKVSIDPTAGNPRSSQRSEVTKVSAYQTTDGKVHFNETEVTNMHLAKRFIEEGRKENPDSAAAAAAEKNLNEQLSELKVTDFWHQVDVNSTYQSLTAPVTVNYQIDVVRVSDGRSVHTGRFTHRADLKSNEVLVGVSSAVPAIENASRANLRDALTSFQPNTGPVASAGLSQINMGPVANAIRRD